MLFKIFLKWKNLVSYKSSLKEPVPEELKKYGISFPFLFLKSVSFITEIVVDSWLFF